MGNRSAVRWEVSEPGSSEEHGPNVGAERAVNGHSAQAVDADGQHHRRWPSGHQTTAKNRRWSGDTAHTRRTTGTTRDSGQRAVARRDWSRRTTRWQY